MKALSYTKFVTIALLSVFFIFILLHFALFQVKYPTEIGTVTTDIVVIGIIVIMLFEAHQLSKTWRHPFIWISVGIFFFFVGSLSELLGEFFIKPSFLKYSVENGSKMFAFGVLAWGIFQWGKEKIETTRRVEKMKELDGLTGLPGRSSFNRELERRYLNIDNFRRYNEIKGEAAGDNVLKKIATILSRNLRNGDLIFRYGGDEFMILIPSAEKDVIRKIAYRLREKIEDELMSHKKAS